MSSNDPTSAREPIAPEQRLAGAQELVLPSYDTWRGEGGLVRFVPSEADAPLRSFCREFASLPAEGREARRRALSTDSLYDLLSFASRSVVYALRTSDPTRWFDGLLAVAVVDLDRLDIRSLWDAVGKLDCTSLRSGVTDAERTDAFEAAALVASAEVAEVLRKRAAAGRPDETELRARCGLSFVQTVYGAGLAQWGFADYRPKLDLLHVAIEIGRLLDSDRYLACSFTIAETLSSYWFGNVDVDERDAILARLHGVSSLIGLLRPDAAPNDAVQMLQVRIAETEESADAATLLRLAQLSAKGVKLSVARGNLFVLIDFSSSRVDVDGLETSESLRRLEADISRILEQAADV